ncbi:MULTISPECIES: hypothetical protein [unclassified Streptomyces]|uniref:hypothetical protein n=1 Tax=unclassified Streptomyces TaxID=2593676 RepID=UPI00131A0815|nr:MULTISPECIES: hypothetical protein [unclassified Streptomyces]MYT33802.1 hypothetical protein [Streptomyces sp. SID8354]
MGRPTKPLDPNHPHYAFISDLRTLRDRAGTRGLLKQTCDTAEISRATYYGVLNGTQLPTRETLARMVKAWGGDVAAWMERRREVGEVGDQTAAAAPVASPQVDRRRAEREFCRHLNTIHTFLYSLEPRDLAGQGLTEKLVVDVLRGTLQGRDHWNDFRIRCAVVEQLEEFANYAVGSSETRTFITTLAVKCHYWARIIRDIEREALVKKAKTGE